MPHPERPQVYTNMEHLKTSWYGNCVVLGDKNMKPLADVSDHPVSNLLTLLRGVYA